MEIGASSWERQEVMHMGDGVGRVIDCLLLWGYDEFTS